MYFKYHEKFQITYKILWLLGVILLGILIIESVQYYRDYNVIDSGIRHEFIKSSIRESVLRIFFLGNYQARIPIYFFVLYLPLFVIFITIFRYSTNRLAKMLSIGLVFFLFLSLIINREYSEFSKWHKRYFNQADSYYKVQLWANKNTKTDALFLIDPNHQKGWQEFSKRSSFGTFRQWLHTSIIVVENMQTFQEGLRRTKLFNKEIADLLSSPESEDKNFHHRSKLRKMIRHSFYSMDSKKLRKLLIDNEIDYVVMLKKYHKKKFPDLKIVYENNHYIVYDAEQVSVK